MGLFSMIGRWFKAAPKKEPPNWRAAQAHYNNIRARYDSALSSNENERRWGQIDFLSARSANNYQTRRILRMKSRYVIANNCFAKGIVDTKVGHLIGTGPTPRFMTGDPDVDKVIKEKFLEWADEVGFVEKLTTTAKAKMASGEGVLLHKTREKQFNSVKLYLQDIECDQVTSLAPATLDQFFLDGVVLDDLGLPVSYSIMRSHPGDYLFPTLNPWAADPVKADKVVFWFRKDRPGQIRGIPELTPALELFEHMREYRLNTLTTAALQACYTVYFQNLSGMGVGADVLKGAESAPMEAVEIERGMGTELPAGYEAKQLDPTHPGTSFESFVYMLMSEACRCVRVPLNLALGTSQKFNFSSARLDHLDYRDDLKVERRDCERVACTPIARAWLEEAVMIPGYLPQGLTPEVVKVLWNWPGFSFMDPEKDAQADTERLSNKTKTYQRWYAEQGLDWEEEFAQVGLEKQRAEELGFELAESKAQPAPFEEAADAA